MVVGSVPALQLGLAGRELGMCQRQLKLDSRQLLAATDVAVAHIEDVPLEVPRAQVRVATVIDDFGAAAADGAIERPIIVQREKVRYRSFAAPLGFLAIDLLAGVFDDLSSCRYGFYGVYAAAVNAGQRDGRRNWRKAAWRK